MKRRAFLKVIGGATGSLAVGHDTGLQAAPPTREAPQGASGLARRALGTSGQKVSIVGFPGLCLIHYDQKRCDAGVRAALDRGVNYFDVAPAYGTAQARMGAALKGIDRARFFLACKTKMRDKAAARKELEESLKLLGTDYFDLYQLHHLVRPEEVAQAVGPGGAMETILKAKEEGKVRLVGFSAHTTKAALAALEGFAFDTVMFPINFVEFFLRGFGKQVLELAQKKGAAVLAIKAMSRGLWPKGVERTIKWWYRPVEDPAELDLAWRFTLSQPGVAAGFPPAFLELLDKAVETAKHFRPITPPEMDQLRRIAEGCESVFLREDGQVAMSCCSGGFPS